MSYPIESKYARFVIRKRAEYGARFVEPSASAELIAAFNDGGRFEVDIMGGSPRWVKRGRIGVTTGWAPTFLLILTRRSLGSSITLDERTRIIRKVAP